MVEKSELDDLIWRLLRGFPESFKICEVIQEGVSYKKSIPESFWFNENKGLYGILGLHRITKADMRKVHSEVIERIIKEINEPYEKMYTDNFARLFHALAILKVRKNDSRLPAIGTNYMYNIAYELWALDDGQADIYEFISGATWYFAEAIKGKNPGLLLTGRRHTFSKLR